PDTPAPPAPPAIGVVVRTAGVAINGEPVAMDELGEVLAKHAQAEGEGAVVSLDAAGDVPMGTVHQVQEQLRQAGLKKVVYAGDLPVKTPKVLPPEKANQLQQKVAAEDLATVRVDAAGVVTVDGEPVPGAKLAAVVGKRLAARPDTVFLLQSERGTAYGAFVQVLAGLQEGGATRIAVEDPAK
ncbi:MAG: biopolymer transporter ExbD, partial [Krumholzibacteria bacterium]|nr:biopolymer transporter ExbD [Candidatus Krumholzibacteria bacterium]